jgi:hypothetical protein
MDRLPKQHGDEEFDPNNPAHVRAWKFGEEAHAQTSQLNLKGLLRTTNQALIQAIIDINPSVAYQWDGELQPGEEFRSRSAELRTWQVPLFGLTSASLFLNRFFGT